MTESKVTTAYSEDDLTARQAPTSVRAYEPDGIDPLGSEVGMNQIGVLDGPVVADPLGETYVRDGQIEHIQPEENA